MKKSNDSRLHLRHNAPNNACESDASVTVRSIENTDNDRLGLRGASERIEARNLLERSGVVSLNLLRGSDIRGIGRAKKTEERAIRVAYPSTREGR